MDNDIQKLWEKVLVELKKNISDPSFNTLFKDTELMKKEEDSLIVNIPSEFSRLWVESNFVDEINSIIEELTPESFKVKFVTNQAEKKENKEQKSKKDEQEKELSLVPTKVSTLKKVEVDTKEQQNKKAIEVLYAAMDSENEKIRVKAALSLLKINGVLD